MFHRLVGLIHRNQKGFTLIELMIAVAIGSLVIGAATMTLSQVFSGSARSSNHMIAVRQVQNAGYWIGYDTQMAQSVEPALDPDGFPLALTWTEWDGTVDGTVNEVVYDIAGDKLQRVHYTNTVLDETTFVAEFVDSTNTSCQLTDGVLIFTVNVTVGTGSQETNETRVYEITPRPNF